MKKLAENPGLRRKLGNAACARVHREFRSDLVIKALLKFYDDVSSDGVSAEPPQ
jgi:glycosyltransferase involved in cell wall biosynthesis